MGGSISVFLRVSVLTEREMGSGTVVSSKVCRIPVAVSVSVVDGDGMVVVWLCF